VAIAKLSSWAAIMGVEDLLLLGLDGHGLPEDLEKIWASYHADETLFARFWQNGFEHANRLVGDEWFREADWRVDAVVEDDPVCNRFIFRAVKDLKLGSSDVRFEKGEGFDWFDAHKYGEREVREMCRTAGLSVVRVWKTTDSEMRKFSRRRALKCHLKISRSISSQTQRRRRLRIT
jgi:uncharacterized SAM-dependent methyltransferase